MTSTGYPPGAWQPDGTWQLPPGVRPSTVRDSCHDCRGEGVRFSAARGPVWCECVEPGTEPSQGERVGDRG